MKLIIEIERIINTVIRERDAHFDKCDGVAVN